jgi:hypothetical protein
VVDEEQLAQISKRITPAKFRRWNTDSSIRTRRSRKTDHFRNPAFARAARQRGILLMSPAARRKAARHAAMIRWRRPGTRPRQSGSNPAVARAQKPAPLKPGYQGAC